MKLGSLVWPKSLSDCRGYSRSRDMSWDAECLRLTVRCPGIVIAMDSYVFVGRIIKTPLSIDAMFVMWSIVADKERPARFELAWHDSCQLEAIK